MSEKADYVAALDAAQDGAVVDVYGYDAVKRDGTWHCEADDEIGAIERHGMSAVHVSEIVCCFHSAHWPRIDG